MERTKEDIKRLSILEVAKSLGMELRKSGRKEYYWTLHDSLKINPEKNFYNWYSKGIYGDVISLVQEIKQVSYKEAYQYLKYLNVKEIDIEKIKKQKEKEQEKKFYYALGKYKTEFTEARKYLKEQRSLSDETIDFFLSKNLLEQVKRTVDNYSEPVIVFKYLNGKKEMVGGSLQGIKENKEKYDKKGYLKQIMYGSKTVEGFNVEIGEPNKLIIFEAPIDLMSYYELKKDKLKDVKLVAMDGLKQEVIERHYAQIVLEKPKEFTKENTQGLFKILVNETIFFEEGKNREDLLTLAVDNDEAGRKFVERLKKEKIKFKTDLPPQGKAEKTDWNDILKHKKKEMKKMTEEQKEKRTWKNRQEYIKEQKAKGTWKNPQEYIKEQKENFMKEYKEGLKMINFPENFKKFLDVQNNINSFVTGEGEKRKYSTNNILSLLNQAEKRNMKIIGILTMRDWNELGRTVKKGEKAFQISCPIIKKKLDEKGEVVKNSQGKPIEILKGFKKYNVFTLSQTTGKDLLYEVKEAKEIDYVNIYKSVKEIVKEKGIDIKFSENLNMVVGTPKGEVGITDGVFLPKNNLIMLQKGLTLPKAIKTLFHETVHALNHAENKCKFGDELYTKQELEAESVAYLLSKHYGIDSKEYSFNYIESYLNEKENLVELKERLDNIIKISDNLKNKIDSTLEKVKIKEKNKNLLEDKIEKYQKEVKEAKKIKKVEEKTMKM